MWYLSSDIDTRVIYVTPNKEVTIGRSIDAQVCNFAITNDASISRRHATLSITNNTLLVEDLGSRYGTSINETEKLAASQKVQLSQNDVINFGKMGTVFKVSEGRFVTCTSTLKGENLQNLKKCLDEAGAVLKNEWDDTCTYLTMPAITLTIKVVLALAHGSHIVTTKFWSKCLDAINNNTPLPNPDDYMPQVIESKLIKESISFLPKEGRKAIFAGKTIVFFSKRQLEMFKVVLVKCSAAPVLLSETKMSKSTLTDESIIVIQYNVTGTNPESQTQKDQINDIVNYLKGKGKRVVPDAEIGLAILYCSTSKYCNPDFNFTSEVIKQVPGDTKVAKILAQESQESTQQSMRVSVVVNETLDSISVTETNSKRKLSDEFLGMNASKKLATGVAITLSNESGKRKFIDDSNGTENPNKKFATDNDDDMFNFKTVSTHNDNKTHGPKLFTKPQKRKADTNEDGLFNFDEGKSNNAAENSSKRIFDINKANNIKDEVYDEEIIVKKVDYNKTVDIAALRGSKLKELEEINSKMDTSLVNIGKIKKETTDEIDEKMQDLALGCTVVTIRKDLIKKERNFGAQSTELPQNGNVTNFKKFRKIWPLYMRASLSESKPVIDIMQDTIRDDMISQSY